MAEIFQSTFGSLGYSFFSQPMFTGYKPNAQIEKNLRHFRNKATVNLKSFKEQVVEMMQFMQNLRQCPANYKEIPCAALCKIKHGVACCPDGICCNFAHNLVELYASHLLRHPGEYKKSICAEKQTTCRLGMHCMYLHPGDIYCNAPSLISETNIAKFVQQHVEFSIFKGVEATAVPQTALPESKVEESKAPPDHT